MKKKRVVREKMWRLHRLRDGPSFSTLKLVLECVKIMVDIFKTIFSPCNHCLKKLYIDFISGKNFRKA